LETDLGCLKGTDVKQRIFVKFLRADGETADYEAVEVTVSPAEGCLQHFVQLGKIEPNRQFKAMGDPELYASGVGIQADNESIGIKGIGHGTEHAAHIGQ
jgi:hypothetical protein